MEESESFFLYVENKINEIRVIYDEIPNEMSEAKIFFLGYLIAYQEIEKQILSD